MGFAVFNSGMNLRLLTNLPLVDMAIYVQSDGRCCLTGLFITSSNVSLLSSARIDNRLSNCANSAAKRLYVLGIRVEGWILMTWLDAVVI